MIHPSILTCHNVSRAIETQWIFLTTVIMLSHRARINELHSQKQISQKRFMQIGRESSLIDINLPSSRGAHATFVYIFFFRLFQHENFSILMPKKNRRKVFLFSLFFTDDNDHTHRRKTSCRGVINRRSFRTINFFP